MWTHAISTSFSLSDNTCASSDGGPGLNLGEQIAGRSRFGTGVEPGVNIYHAHIETADTPKNPSCGRSRSGSAISTFTPHTTVVFPRRTSAEPSAVEIEPERARSAICAIESECAPTYIHRDVPPLWRSASVGADALSEKPLEVDCWVQPLEGKCLQRVTL